MNKALVFEAPWQLRLEERPFPNDPSANEVIVRIRASGICGTDLGILRGDYSARAGVILGHESAGEVLHCGSDVRAVREGDRVVIDPTYFCGYCRMCRTERPNHCKAKTERESGVSQDGTFALFYRTDERFVYRIADHVSFAEATLTEPLSCALTGLQHLRLRADMDTAVVGAGPMGMLYCYALASRGFFGTVIEKSLSRSSLCRDLLPTGWSLSSELADIPDSLDLVIDTSSVAMPWALGCLRRGGQVLTIGLADMSSALQPALLADRSISVVGSIDSIGTFSLACSMIEAGAIPVQRLISHQMPLDRYEQAFALLGMDLSKQRRLTEGIRALKVVFTI